MQKKLQDKFHTKLISYDQFMEYKLYDKNKGYYSSNNKELWGSIKGAEYGGDQNSLWETNQLSIEGVPFKQLMNEYFVNQRKKGWKLINEK